MPHLLRYVMGEFPLQGGLPWHMASEIFGIAFVQNCHWVAYKIDLEFGVITVYDSLSKSMSWDDIKEEFLNLRSYIPMTLQHAQKYSDKFARFEPFSAFEVVQYQHLVQQNNDYDCGIMAVKVMSV